MGHTVIQFSLFRPSASRSNATLFLPLFTLFTLFAPLISALVHFLLAHTYTHPHMSLTLSAFILAHFMQCYCTPTFALMVYIFFTNKFRKYLAQQSYHSWRIYNTRLRNCVHFLRSYSLRSCTSYFLFLLLALPIIELTRGAI